MFTGATKSLDLTPKAVIRLKSDLEELNKYPLVGASAAPLKNNLGEWHCNVIGPEGSPYAGIPIHFVLEFGNYPVDAPNAYFITPITYYGGVAVKDSKGRMAVCLNLFGNFGYIHTEWKNSEGTGWTSSYTVSNILSNLQAAMLDNYFSKFEEHVEETMMYALQGVCKDCGHCGSDINSYFPPVPTETIASGTSVSPVENIVCYVSKEKFNDSINMGYGIHFNRNSASSQCEYISKNSYDSGVRTSSMKKPFNEWMPVYINEEHFKRVKPLFEKFIMSVPQSISKSKYISGKVLDVMSALMNSAVVEVMNAKNNLTANDKFIDGYFAFYKLILEYKTDALAQNCNNIVKKFISKSSCRNKSVVPNLGTFLITVLVSDYKWADVASALQEETDTRNVFWYTVGNRQNPPLYPELSNSTVDNNRVRKVFDATVISRNLICFQRRFMEYAESVNMGDLSNNYGIVDDRVKADLKSIYSTIIKISTWREYYDFLGLSYESDAKRLEQLKNAVISANNSGYLKAPKFRGGRRY